MKKFLIGFGTMVLIFAFVWVGVVSAQSGDDGYPIETEEPTEEPTTEPTEDPTQEPTQEPTEAPTIQPTQMPTQDPTQEPDEIPLETPEPIGPSPVCDGTRVHSVIKGLAIRYDVSYGELVSYFCDDHLGVGEIALALKTMERLEREISLDELLALRANDGLGWGEIWQSLGMIGNGLNNHPEFNNGQTEGLEKNKNRNINQHLNQGQTHQQELYENSL